MAREYLLVLVLDRKVKICGDMLTLVVQPLLESDLSKNELCICT